MALPALFIPPSLDASGLAPEVAERLRASWGAWWVPFREELRASPPVENTNEERRAVARLGSHIFEMMAEFGPDLNTVLQSGVQEAIEKILSRATEDVETERRLGFHWLQQSLETLGKVVDTLAFLMPLHRMTEDLIQPRPTVDELEEKLDPTSTLLLRLELDAFVAWDLVSEGTAREFCEWARRAAKAANQLEVRLPFMCWSLQPADAAHADLQPETTLDSRGVATVLRLLDEAPGPNEAMRRLFRADDPQARKG